MNTTTMLIQLTAELEESAKLYEEIVADKEQKQKDPLMVTFAYELLRHCRATHQLLAQYAQVIDQVRDTPALEAVEGALYEIVVQHAIAWGVVDEGTLELLGGDG